MENSYNGIFSKQKSILKKFFINIYDNLLGLIWVVRGSFNRHNSCDINVYKRDIYAVVGSFLTCHSMRLVDLRIVGVCVCVRGGGYS